MRQAATGDPRPRRRRSPAPSPRRRNGGLALDPCPPGIPSSRSPVRRGQARPRSCDVRADISPRTCQTAFVEGDSFHRYDRAEMKQAQMQDANGRGHCNFSHFGPEANLLENWPPVSGIWGKRHRGDIVITPMTRKRPPSRHRRGNSRPGETCRRIPTTVLRGFTWRRRHGRREFALRRLEDRRGAGHQFGMDEEFIAMQTRAAARPKPSPKPSCGGCTTTCTTSARNSRRRTSTSSALARSTPPTLSSRATFRHPTSASSDSLPQSARRRLPLSRDDDRRQLDVARQFDRHSGQQARPRDAVHSDASHSRTREAPEGRVIKESRWLDVPASCTKG